MARKTGVTAPPVVTDATTIPSTPDAAFLSRVLRDGPDGKYWPIGFVWDERSGPGDVWMIARQLWPIRGKTNRVSDCFPAPVRPAITRLLVLEICRPSDVADALDAAVAARTSEAV